MSWYTGFFKASCCIWYSHKVIGQGAYVRHMPNHLMTPSTRPLRLII